MCSYPHVHHRGRGVEELADDVGGGGNAEEDGSDDLLPPGQQQHGILPPATPPPRFTPLYQADRGVPLLSVQAAVGEVVAVVWTEAGKAKGVVATGPARLHRLPARALFHHMDTGGWRVRRCCIHRGRTCHC